MSTRRLVLGVVAVVVVFLFSVIAAAFLLGVGGLALAFHRWRAHGDRFGRDIAAAGFALWAAALIVAAVTGGQDPGRPGWWVAVAALLVGAIGGTALYTRMLREERDAA